MKINKVHWLVLPILIVILPISALADAKVYDSFTIHNNTDYDLSVNNYNNHCFNTDKQQGLPATIKAHTSLSFSEYENNQGIPCANSQKHMDFRATAQMPDGQGEYQLEFHYERTPLDDDGNYSSDDDEYGLKKWEVGIHQTDVTDGQPGIYDSDCQEQSGTKVTGACLITTLAKEGSTPGAGYYDSIDHHFKPMDVDITVGNPNGNNESVKFVSIQLGAVAVTDGYGNPIDADGQGYVTLNTLKSYVFHFSKTQQVCETKNLILTCPSSIEYVKSGTNEIVFTCAQTGKGDSVCPWTTEDNNPQPQPGPDVYS
ncbi:MAG: hypothetical protein EP298_04325 [Gammaproteobacteria bacterium]|nr:MAG: hypothetical protein EP298_04325 [Gammaproteobacteria bacterium]UTW41638.1 hypothetical protein KFE69_08975 [bacterium SCSIO 12844]